MGVAQRLRLVAHFHLEVADFHNELKCKLDYSNTWDSMDQPAVRHCFFFLLFSSFYKSAVQFWERILQHKWIIFSHSHCQMDKIPHEYAGICYKWHVSITLHLLTFTSV